MDMVARDDGGDGSGGSGGGVCVSMGTSLLLHNQVFLMLGNFGFDQVGGKKVCLLESFQRMGSARH